LFGGPFEIEREEPREVFVVGEVGGTVVGGGDGGVELAPDGAGGRRSNVAPLGLKEFI
jgi:hypothetical protein